MPTATTTGVSGLGVSGDGRQQPAARVSRPRNGAGLYAKAESESGEESVIYVRPTP